MICKARNADLKQKNKQTKNEGVLFPPLVSGKIPVELVLFLISMCVGITEERQCKDTQEQLYVSMRIWCDASASQTTAKIPSNPVEARKRQGRIPLQISEGSWFCIHLDFVLLASKTARK